MALGAMLVTGVHSDSVLGSVLGALRRQPQHPGVEYYCACLLHISKLWYRERNMVTPERGSGFGKTQADLVEFVSGRIANALRLDARLSPDMILQLRALCESSPIVQLYGAELWNSIRCQRVSRRYASPKSRDSGFNMGTLSKPQYYVTPKKISIDLSNAEQKVPPVFKTWQSPVHKRRRQRGAGRAPQRVKFGTQRISSNYLKKKRNKVIAT
ncbi:hypothetical protein AGDE_08739 [Angomonas deanei]|uniref:Uncharacterized protein n=1 Tax=Angomonas deanei TaxID=59799 RepID=A0A7G2C6I5_9TRYP|nr:hypothetical protein AGDE_08739 [Angomonas deanei]CAD2215376.1 hypothetical protein, conserved [Angomonas deanei]|eukprot:EPY32345.1 hypothetical protein AGDE_08739 [Angomonas deanei]